LLHHLAWDKLRKLNLIKWLKHLLNNRTDHFPQFHSVVNFVIMTEIETHPFEAYVPANASVLIVGSFPGKGQAEEKLKENHWFYGAKRNQFWSIISDVYNVELKTTESKKKLFSDKGIAIADIFLKVRRKENNNTDDNLEVIQYNDEAIKKILQTTPFELILFTSKFVEKHFLKLFPAVVNGQYLPSPSPRYARITKAEKVTFYKNKLPK